MRINKLFVGLLVLGLAVSVLGAVTLAAKKPASDSAVDNVSWTIQGFVELTIDDSEFDFSQIDAGVDSVTEDNANILHVFSNTEWTLSFSVTGKTSDHLSVDLSSDKGKGNDDITVGYSLNNLRSMDPGSYSATVTYTVAAD